ncbi:adenylyl-sulfate kinase [Candidatus Thioglobus autotrophicus]|uniref:adenylyl-sulfate kinase n=1 Tax=Candidatus Thioglobus autotrophicus TaxID=1705394 RepID=UPI00299DAE70|nr:adenylyl-sulfate kinase [Candidatus Thioglobus autotrophicus]WPE17749.1 adenylyl-sulfate kinase [Candidatus Thioglobus autotrophicus]
MNKCFWITGLSATGKTTLSTLLVEHMRLSGKKVILLDGDELRQVLSENAYTREERISLGMRYSRLCKLLSSQGVDVVIAVIGLFKELHEWNRENIPNYVEVFIDTPLAELRRRDPKDLYKNVDSGRIQNVVGIDLEVDFPYKPDIYLKWLHGKSIDSMFEELLNNIK